MKVLFTILFCMISSFVFADYCVICDYNGKTFYLESDKTKKDKFYWVEKSDRPISSEDESALYTWWLQNKKKITSLKGRYFLYDLEAKKRTRTLSP